MIQNDSIEKVVIIGIGAVARCTLPILLDKWNLSRDKYRVIDFNPLPESVEYCKNNNIELIVTKIDKNNYVSIFNQYIPKNSLVIDLAWNIDTVDFVQWCQYNNCLYINTSFEVWNPYQETDLSKRTLAYRHTKIGNIHGKGKPTAIIDHGANPGLVSHFVKHAMIKMTNRINISLNCSSTSLNDYFDGVFITDPNVKQVVETYNGTKEICQERLVSWPELAHLLKIHTIHISERDTQITNKPKEVGEFVNTWSVEGFYEEGIAPAEMGWGNHEYLPKDGSINPWANNQALLMGRGCDTWVRSFVPSTPIIGMVIRHGEAYSISKWLSYFEDNKLISRPTVHYVYLPCDAALASIHEMKMNDYKHPERTRILKDEIIKGNDELGALLITDDGVMTWCGTILDIEESRQLVPNQNATVLQVACSVYAASTWMLDNNTKEESQGGIDKRNLGFVLPEDLDHEAILELAKPYLGKFVCQKLPYTCKNKTFNEFRF